jgi:hypothetical protein
MQTPRWRHSSLCGSGYVGLRSSLPERSRYGMNRRVWGLVSYTYGNSAMEKGLHTCPVCHEDLRCGPDSIQGCILSDLHG